MELHDSQLDRLIADAMLADRHRLRRRLEQLRRQAASAKGGEAEWLAWQRDLWKSSSRRRQRAEQRPVPTYDDNLPIAARRADIAAALLAHQVVVICGETGSGKSTQIPKICLEIGRGVDGMIGHTQPRRIAARSVSARIAEELGAEWSTRVGYKIRFTDTTRPETRVKVMTDGILLAETLHDRFLDQYDTLILDEAHERSLNVDLLLGLLARLLPRRPDLKLVIMSATIDAERFADHFAQSRGRFAAARERIEAPVLHVSGRTYPVEVRYRPPRIDEAQADPDLSAALAIALGEINSLERGDVLVFLPTERDIHDAMRVLKGHPAANDGRTELLPLYARLSVGEQQRIFQPHANRRIVLATNVAESSLTVPGIRYVIDTGLARISRYSTRGKVQRLPVEPISQASADQRAGRCGRVAPGVCVRLYSEEDYRARERYTTPEIRRTTLAGPILQTKALRLGPLEGLPLLDPPHSDMVRDGYETLFELGALDDRRELTALGRTLARLPVDPRIGRMILAGKEEGCLREILVIAAALEVQDPRDRPPDRKDAADQAHARFRDSRSDFLGLLKIWNYYQELKGELNRGQLRRACQHAFLSYARLREWSDIHRQLLTLVRQDLGVALSGPAKSADATTASAPPSGTWSPSESLSDGSGGSGDDKRRYAALHRAILTGLLSGIAYRSDGCEYTAAGGTKVLLWPGSGPYSQTPGWIVAAEVVEITRRYARMVASIDPRWIEPLASHLVKRGYSDPTWRRSSGTVLAMERVTLFGLPVAKRRVPYGPIDPVSTRDMFVREGLVGGDIDLGTAFFRNNQQLRDDLARQAAKSRRGDLVVDQRTCFDFYHERLPPEVYDVPSLHRWRRVAERGHPRLLWMKREDLVGEVAPPVDEHGFPESLEVNELRLPLKYRFEPGMADDGLTLVVPLEALGQVTAARIDWIVPALLPEKVERLIRSLPKSLRRELPPTDQATAKVMERLRYGEGPFLASVANSLSEVSKIAIAAEHFQLDKLPHYLQVFVRVVGEHGQTLASGRDIEQIWAKLGVRPLPFRELADPEWTRSGLTNWNWNDLPEEITLHRGGIALPAFPTLIDRGSSVDLRLLDSRDEAARRLRRGMRRLFFLAERASIEEQVEWLPGLPQWIGRLASRMRPERLRGQLADLITDRAFLGDRPLPRSPAEYQIRLATGQLELEPAVVDIVRLVSPLAQAYDELKQQLDAFPPPRLPDTARDVLRQLDRMLVRDFLTETPWKWLEQLPRYCKAAVERLRRVGSNAARDREAEEELERLWSRYEGRLLSNRSLGRFDSELETYRWMLEEYRVSLFAQTLGTSIPISPQRLERQWERTRGARSTRI